MYSKTFILYPLLVGISCNNNIIYPADSKKIKEVSVTDTVDDTNPYRNIGEIPLPAGFVRIKRKQDTFAYWLLNVKLKNEKTVYLFNGRPKANQTAQFAVADIPVGDKDLQQCADAVMRLRAEYLFDRKQFSDIRFTDNAGTAYHFNEPYTHKNLQHYLERVFGMCGSASLAKQLSSIRFKDIEPGDVLIRGGFPGHAVMVMDVATNREGKKIYLLAQSYMPAQDIHILVNPINKALSPWYEVNKDESVQTPEYTFRKNELKRW